MSGYLMSLGGYINHRRVCSGVLWVVGFLADLDLVFGAIGVNELKIKNAKLKKDHAGDRSLYWHFELI
jgi:hypothetical protein